MQYIIISFVSNNRFRLKKRVYNEALLIKNISYNVEAGTRWPPVVFYCASKGSDHVSVLKQVFIDGNFILGASKLPIFFHCNLHHEDETQIFCNRVFFDTVLYSEAELRSLAFLLYYGSKTEQTRKKKHSVVHNT